MPPQHSPSEPQPGPGLKCSLQKSKRLPSFRVFPKWASSSWVVVVQSQSCVQLFAACHGLQHAMDCSAPWTAARQASLSFTVSWSLLKFTSIESMMPSNHLILCHFFLLLPSIFPALGSFSNELALRNR